MPYKKTVITANLVKIELFVEQGLQENLTSHELTVKYHCEYRIISNIITKRCTDLVKNIDVVFDSEIEAMNHGLKFIKKYYGDFSEILE